MSLHKTLSVVALVALSTAACGGGDEASSAPTDATPAAPAAMAPDLSNAGGIDGMVMATAAAPGAQAIQMAADPFCMTAHSEAVMNTPVMMDANGGLMNAVVHIASGLDNYTFDAATDVILLDQVGCMYDPHIVALQTGQTVTIRNSDQTLHNVNVQPSSNPAFNNAQPMANMTTDKTFATAEIGIPARCDVHPWMSAFINVFDHPYFAVSGADGSFSIANLPPGDYVIEAWHETLGTQTQSVTVEANATATASLNFQ